MADGVKVKINQDFAKQVHQAAVQAMTEIFTEDIVPEAKSLVPVDTGALRDSIGVIISDDESAKTVSATLYTEAHHHTKRGDLGYGFYVEHGTSRNRTLTKKAYAKRHFFERVVNDRTPKRPFLFPAYIRFRRKIIARWKELIGEQGKKAA